MGVLFLLFYVYILKSKVDGSYYIGHTKDLEDRVKRHNSGRSKYTKAKTPWKLCYKECFNSRAEAVKREIDIKKQKSSKILGLLAGV